MIASPTRRSRGLREWRYPGGVLVCQYQGAVRYRDRDTGAELELIPARACWFVEIWGRYLMVDREDARRLLDHQVWLDQDRDRRQLVRLESSR